MAGRTILVTGVTRFIGSQLAGLLADLPGVDRVIGVDAALPEPSARARMGRAEFARADIRNPLIARVIDAAKVDTVVHASASATPASAVARSMAKEMNVLGTMQLLAACQRSASVKHLVVRSTAAVYGGSSRDPAVLTEGMSARSVPSIGMARDAIDIEGYVRGFSRRRPDVRVAVPRFAEIIGPIVRTPLVRYFSMSPFVPVMAGRDARLQFVHEQDSVAVMRELAMGEFAGIVNVAGAGTITLHQAVHRAGRVPLPVPSAGLDAVGTVYRLARLRGFSAEQIRLFSHGRVLDTTRLTHDVGFTPQFTTMEAFDDFARTLKRPVDRSAVRRAEVAAAGVLRVRPEPDSPAAAAPSGPARPTLISIDGHAGPTRKARSRTR